MKKQIRSLVAFLALIGVAIAGEMITVNKGETPEEFEKKLPALIDQIATQERGWLQNDTRQRQKIVDQLRVTLAADSEVEGIAEVEAGQLMSEGRMLTFTFQKRFVAVYVPFRDWSRGTAGLKNLTIFAAGKVAERESEKNLVIAAPTVFYRECNYGARPWLTENMKFDARGLEITSDIDLVVSQILAFSSSCTRLGEKG